MQPIFYFSLALCLAVAWQPVLAGNSIDYSISRGGKLYDKWFKVNSHGAPASANPAYPDNGGYKGKKGADWRCKECHGWDYRGKDGAYATGKHATGIVGVYQARSMSAANLASLLRGQSHGYTRDMLSDTDLADLANFLNQGMLDMDSYIARDTKKVAGEAAKGAGYYETICAGCHGLDGKGEDESPPLGEISNQNPWETLHKIRNGQPATEMPALGALELQVTLDILAYLQTLPKD